MKTTKLLIIFFIAFYTCQAFAQTSLTNINHLNLNSNKYKVTFTLDKQIKFKVKSLPKQNKITIEFLNSKFAVKTLPTKKLDANFIKNLHKSNKNSRNLKITLLLSKNATFDKSYAISKDGQLLISLELKNNKLKPIAKKEKKLDNKFIIMLDPGHGGADSGTIGSTPNILEKNIVLSYAKELKNELSKFPQYKVIMTRNSDKTMSLSARKNKAHSMKADLFISLHADSNNNSNMQGSSVYTLSNKALDSESQDLSQRENKADILKDDQLLEHNQEIAHVLIDMVYQDTKNASINLAESIAGELDKEIKMMHKFHRSAGFKVLKGVDIPAILIEIGYLSNKEDEKSLTSYIHKKIFARAMIRGIERYISKNKK